MTTLIIYPHNEGIAIIHSTGEISLNEVARKDVPAGVPYLSIDSSQFPANREFRGAWEADFTNPDGYGIGHDAWYAEQKQGA
jgi:hypothetical protein